MRRSGAALVALGGALAVAACGTTVPMSTRTDALSSPQAIGADSPSAGSVAPTVPRPGTASRQVPARSPGAAPGSHAPRAVDAAPVSGALKPVEVGIIVETNTQEMASSLGFGDIDNGDEHAVAQATVDAANKRGGLYGHKIVPVFFSFDPTYSGSYASLEQAACSHFTEDHHVVAILTVYHIDFGMNLVSCAAKKGVAVIAPLGYGAFSEADFRRYPLFVTPGTATIESAVRAQVDSLSGSGFLSHRNRIGMIRYSGPQFESGEKAMRAALSRHGLSLTMSADVGTVSQTSDIGAVASAVASAELKFRAADIDRVLFISNGALLALQFMQAADKQGYRPKYGLTSTDAPAALVGLAPQGQLQGAHGIGWGPFWDLTDVRKASPPGLPRCLAELKAHGQQPASGTPQAVAAQFCEQMDVLTFGPRLQRVTGQAVVTAIESIGSRYASPSTFDTYFASGRRAGARTYRAMAFDQAAGSMTYTSAPRSFR